MSNDKTWDSDVYSAKYANEFTMDLSVGLNAVDTPQWGNWECAWFVDANSIVRRYKDGKLVAVTTPEGELPIAMLEELTGIELAAEDVVSFTSDLNVRQISVQVNHRTVAIRSAIARGFEWRLAPSNGSVGQAPISRE